MPGMLGEIDGQHLVALYRRPGIVVAQTAQCSYEKPPARAATHALYPETMEKPWTHSRVSVTARLLSKSMRLKAC